MPAKVALFACAQSHSIKATSRVPSATSITTGKTSVNSRSEEPLEFLGNLFADPALFMVHVHCDCVG